MSFVAYDALKGFADACVQRAQGNAVLAGDRAGDSGRCHCNGRDER